MNISFSWDDSGLKKFRRKIKELHEQRKITSLELMPDSFIRQYTDFQTLQAILDAGGIENSEDFGDEKFSKFISTHTQFSTWEEMIEVATAEYIKLKLGF